MPPLTVARLEFTERAEAKMWDHGVAFDRLPEVLENRYVVVRNRGERDAEFVLIGRDNSGRSIVAPIGPRATPSFGGP